MGVIFTFRVPLTIQSANVLRRAHRMTTARHDARHRRDVALAVMEEGVAARWRAFRASARPPYVVTMTRLYSGREREFDEAAGGNLESGFKAIRDEVAALLGLDDDPSSPVTWRCLQRHDGHSAVEITIEEVSA